VTWCPQRGLADKLTARLIVARLTARPGSCSRCNTKEIPCYAEDAPDVERLVGDAEVMWEEKLPEGKVVAVMAVEWQAW